MKIVNIIFSIILIVSTCFYSCKNNINENQNAKKESNEDVINDTTISLVNKQLIIVLAKDSIDTKGYLFKYELLNNQWIQIDKVKDVIIGKNGITKGRGVDMSFDASGKSKVEGDGKSPSGIFTIGDAFGFTSLDKAKGIKLNYHPIDSFTRCIEDDRSKYYNQIVQGDEVQKDWIHADKMRNVELYEWGFFVDHNTPPINNAGSCVFFHIWRGPGRYTLGCTAMSKENILDLLYWINPIKNPLIIQYIASDYEILKTKMDLPDIVLP